MSVMDLVIQGIQGRNILRDWVGDGGTPVAQELAERRAEVCARCPMNYKGSWLWSMATSLAIAAQMELRRAMKLELPNDEKLHVCEVCGCKLQLKVHVPFDYIYRYTPPEQWDKYPDLCWQKHELNQIKK